MGLVDEASRYRAEFSIDKTPGTDELQEEGELVVLLHGGLAPLKYEKSITMTNPNTGRLLRVALPAYRARPRMLAHARVTIEEHSVLTEPVEDLSAIAIKTLDAKMPAIMARTLARMVTKDVLARETGNHGSTQGLLGLAVNVANTLTERADTRSWFTLPGQIQLARLALTPGEYVAKIELLGTEGQSLQTDERRVTLRKGEKTYISLHWVPPYPGVTP